MINAQTIADSADVIIGGYAYLQCSEGIKAVDLNREQGVAVFQNDGTLIETDMDDIELSIAQAKLHSAMKYMG